MQSVIGALRVILGADTAQFDTGMDRAQAKLTQVGKRMEKVGASIQRVGAGLSVAVTAPMLLLARELANGAKSAAHAAGQVNAALTSMGDGAGRSLAQLAAQADRLSATSLFDDDEILTKVTANMLTFGSVAEAQFDRAQQAALDLSARMGTDLQSSALMVGKALNDPAKGLAALRRVGIQFTEQQQTQIKAMAAAGDAAGAQAVMLSELERQFGGAAAAARAADPMAGAMLDLGRAMGTLEQHFVPIISGMSKMITSVADWVAALDPVQSKFVLIGGAVAAAIGPVLIALGMMASGIGVLLPILGAAGAALGAFALPIVAVVAVIAALAFAFKDDIVPAMKAFGATLKEVIGPKIAPLIEAAKALFATFVSAMRGFFGDGSGSILPLLTALGTVVARVFGAIVDIITAALRVLNSVFGAIGAALRGDWSAMWGHLGNAVSALVSGVIKAFTTLFPNVSATIQRMYNSVKEWMGRKLGEIFTGVINRVKAVGDAFYNMYDAVVGHSYVPDMVEGVAAWMAKLDAGMVTPARNATEATKTAFEKLRDDVSAIMESLLTDAERRTREIVNQVKTINDAVRAGILSRAEADRAIRGINTEVFDQQDRQGPLGAMADGRDIQRMMKEGLTAISERAQEVRDQMNEAGREFGYQFADVMTRVIQGDIKGVFLDMLGSVLDNLLQKIGQQLFSALSSVGGKGGGFWGSLANAVVGGFLPGGGMKSKMLGGGAKIPGFNNGGSFKIGGNPGIDKNLIQFWGSKGETVDIHRKGADRGSGSPLLFDLRGAVMTTDLLQQMQSMAAQAGGMALSSARQVVPADANRVQTYSRRR